MRQRHTTDVAEMPSWYKLRTNRTETLHSQSFKFPSPPFNGAPETSGRAIDFAIDLNYRIYFWVRNHPGNIKAHSLSLLLGKVVDC